MRRGCRIDRLERPAHPLNPTALTTTCGWTDLLEQGREWQADPARDRWLTHQCQTEATP
jgi:hypothetical protein